MDFRTDWFVLDVVEDIDAEGSNQQQRSVTVYLQSLSSDDVVEMRVPRQESTLPEYRNLRDEVRSAELAGRLTSAN